MSCSDWDYFDLENGDDLDRITHDYSFFFSEHPDSSIIDDGAGCSRTLQRVAWHRRCRPRPKRALYPHRLQLSGTKTNLSERLAGRVGIIEMGTLKMNERHEQPLPPIYEILNTTPATEQLAQLRNLDIALETKQVMEHFLYGGYPEPMSHRPEDIDAKGLPILFSRQPPRTKRLYCYLLGHSKNEVAIDLLIECLRSKDAGIRYQAAEALGTAGIKTPRIVNVLIRALDDLNDYVAKEVASALYHLEEKEAASAMLKRLAIVETRNREVGKTQYKEIFSNTSYSRYGNINVLGKKDRDDTRFVRVSQLKKWAEGQL